MSFSGQALYVQTLLWINNELGSRLVAKPSYWLLVIRISHSRRRDYVNVPLIYVHDSIVMFASVLGSTEWHIGRAEALDSHVKNRREKNLKK